MLMNNSVSAAWRGGLCRTIAANIGDVLFAAQLASEHPDHCFPTIRGICTLITDGYAYMSIRERHTIRDTGTLDSLIYHPIFECGAFQSRPRVYTTARGSVRLDSMA